ncbi:restriction endonuclease subunit S [Acinetobacter haemolyticus]|uniref:restriction endonuclease subunit S n=1 Tax=Acinetobacter haemolyticus TaxID=29430 RepID=UPI000F66861F|nr:restriction endonuclease subunit S [Acinetobacter haemolyticus]QHI30238.1 restriction endonuclease subunit S [Acinetobacter haemolyticus]RSC82449.1 restriction endonuclease subunit S [Acinetobacter haemolyticus]
MAKYRKYAEYKDSGVEWLGEIPSHWDLYSLKRSVDKCTNGFWGGEPDGRNDLCVLRVADFNRDNFTINEDKLTLRSVLPKEAESRLLKKGDLLIEKSGGGEKTLVGCVVQFDKDFPAITSNFVAKMTPNVITDSKYLTYTFAHLYSGRVNFPSIKQTTGIQNLDSEAYLMEKFGFPSKNEQIQIANFLDHETAKIDHLIEKQQKLIELLKEKRQAVISHAVTKGLNPDVTMKDSGVEWLGQVPEHWVVKSYRLASRIYRGKFGHRPRNDPAFYDGDYPFIQTGDVARAGKYITSYSQTLNEKGKEVSQLFPKGTLMMAIAANIGDIAILGFEAYAPDSVVGFKPNNDIDLEFLRYSFIAALPALEQTSTQSTQANLNVERIGAVKSTFPSLQEQREIVGYLDNLLEQYRNLVKIAENAISLMQERRTALISAAVTGKIDVRNWQAPTVVEAQTELNA